MEQIKQLRQMRDEAQARIEALPDYRLVTSLDALIADLEEAFGSDEGTGEAEEEPSSPVSLAADPDDAVEVEEPLEIEPPVEEPAIETNTGVLGAEESAAESEIPPSADEELEAAVEEAVEDAPPAEDADLVSIFDRGSDPDEADIAKALNFGQQANGSGEDAEATPEDEEADAISKAIAELDADLAKTEFGN